MGVWKTLLHSLKTAVFDLCLLLLVLHIARVSRVLDNDALQRTTPHHHQREPSPLPPPSAAVFPSLLHEYEPGSAAVNGSYSRYRGTSTATSTGSTAAAANIARGSSSSGSGGGSTSTQRVQSTRTGAGAQQQYQRHIIEEDDGDSVEHFLASNKEHKERSSADGMKKVRTSGVIQQNTAHYASAPSESAAASAGVAPVTAGAGMAPVAGRGVVASALKDDRGASIADGGRVSSVTEGSGVAFVSEGEVTSIDEGAGVTAAGTGGEVAPVVGGAKDDSAGPRKFLSSTDDLDMVDIIVKKGSLDVKASSSSSSSGSGGGDLSNKDKDEREIDGRGSSEDIDRKNIAKLKYSDKEATTKAGQSQEEEDVEKVIGNHKVIKATPTLKIDAATQTEQEVRQTKAEEPVKQTASNAGTVLNPASEETQVQERTGDAAAAADTFATLGSHSVAVKPSEVDKVPVPSSLVEETDKETTIREGEAQGATFSSQLEVDSATLTDPPVDGKFTSSQLDTINILTINEKSSTGVEPLEKEGVRDITASSDLNSSSSEMISSTTTESPAGVDARPLVAPPHDTLHTDFSDNGVNATRGVQEDTPAPSGAEDATASAATAAGNGTDGEAVTDGRSSAKEPSPETGEQSAPDTTEDEEQPGEEGEGEAGAGGRKRKTSTANRTDTKEKGDAIETYSQFAERVAMEKKNDVVSGGSGPGGVPGSSTSLKPGKLLPSKKYNNKNYAGTDCGSKLLAANPEAQHAGKVIQPNRDEYLLSDCKQKTWFVVELCESIRPSRFEIANFELFSNLPRDLTLWGSQRFPSRDWTPLGSYTGEESNRAVQAFQVNTDTFFKYIKVEVSSHYGSEYYCPVSLFRIYGVSEFEVIDSMEELGDDLEEDNLDQQDQDKEHKEEKKERSMLPTVLRSMLTNVLGVLNRGPLFSITSKSNQTPAVDECTSLDPRYKIDETKCSLAPTINWHLGCYEAEYKYVIKLPIVERTVENREFCKSLVDNLCGEKINKEMREDDDQVKTDSQGHSLSGSQVDLNYACSTRVCGNNYVCVMLCSHHLLALCHIKHYNLAVNTALSSSSTNSSLPNNSSSVAGSSCITDNDTLNKDNLTANSNLVTTEDSLKEEKEPVPNFILPESGENESNKLQHQLPSGAVQDSQENVSDSPSPAVTTKEHVGKSDTNDQQQERNISADEPAVEKNNIPGEGKVEETVKAEKSTNNKKSHTKEPKATPSATATSDSAKDKKPSTTQANKRDKETQELGGGEQKTNSASGNKEKKTNEGGKRDGGSPNNGGDSANSAAGNGGKNGSPLPTVEQDLQPPKDSNGGHVVTAPPNKESVVIRLSNKIKVLEHNLSISSQYLEELSQRYKRQMEEMQHQFSSAVTALNRSSEPSREEVAEQAARHQQQMDSLQQHLLQLNQTITELMVDHKELTTSITERHLTLMVIEALVLIILFYFCIRRRQPELPEHRHQIQQEIQLQMQQIQQQIRAGLDLTQPHLELSAVKEQPTVITTRPSTPAWSVVTRTSTSGSSPAASAGDGCSDGSSRSAKATLQRRGSIDSVSNQKLMAAMKKEKNRRGSIEDLTLGGNYQSLLLESALCTDGSATTRRRKKKGKDGVKRSNSSISSTSSGGSSNGKAHVGGPKEHQQKSPPLFQTAASESQPTTWTAKIERQYKSQPVNSCLERFGESSKSAHSPPRVISKQDITLRPDSSGRRSRSISSGSSTATEGSVGEDKNKMLNHRLALSKFEKQKSKAPKESQREAIRKQNLNKSSAGVLFSCEQQNDRKNNSRNKHNKHANIINNFKTREVNTSSGATNTCMALQPWAPSSPSHLKQVNRLTSDNGNKVPDSINSFNYNVLNTVSLRADSFMNRNSFNYATNLCESLLPRIPGGALPLPGLNRISECSESSALNNSQDLEPLSDGESPVHQCWGATQDRGARYTAGPVACSTNSSITHTTHHDSSSSSHRSLFNSDGGSRVAPVLTDTSGCPPAPSLTNGSSLVNTVEKNTTAVGEPDLTSSLPHSKSTPLLNTNSNSAINGGGDRYPTYKKSNGVPVKGAADHPLFNGDQFPKLSSCSASNSKAARQSVWEASHPLTNQPSQGLTSSFNERFSNNINAATSQGGNRSNKRSHHKRTGSDGSISYNNKNNPSLINGSFYKETIRGNKRSKKYKRNNTHQVSYGSLANNDTAPPSVNGDDGSRAATLNAPVSRSNSESNSSECSRPSAPQVQAVKGAPPASVPPSCTAGGEAS